jgi:predicted RNA-binding Zn ribbon-like protein
LQLPEGIEVVTLHDMELHNAHPASLYDVVEFINTWSPVGLDATKAQSTPQREQARREHRLAGATEAEREQLAARLHQVFLGDTSQERRATLNGLIASVSLLPSVGAAGHTWMVADKSKAGAAGLIAGLWNHAGADPDLERLGTCAANRCLDAFHDSTQAHTRKFCSLTCQNRAKVAAFRARKRA